MTFRGNARISSAKMFLDNLFRTDKGVQYSTSSQQVYLTCVFLHIQSYYANVYLYVNKMYYYVHELAICVHL